MTHTQITLSDQQTAIIIAALRMWQHESNPNLMDIATNGGEHGALDDDEIDQLCEALNFAEPAQAVQVCVAIEGGVVQSVFSDAFTIAPIVIDYDTEGCDPSELQGVMQNDEQMIPAWVSYWAPVAPLALPVTTIAKASISPQGANQPERTDNET
jgi:hypothetical protein